MEEEGKWDIQEASTGGETLEKLDKSVDVLVLDRKMPALSGLQVMDRLDETDFNGDIIAISAYKPDSHLNEDDVEAYLTKPISREELLDLLDQSTD